MPPSSGREAGLCDNSLPAPNPWGCLPGRTGPLGSFAFLPLRLCRARLSAGDRRAAFPEAWLYRGESTLAPGASALAKEARVSAVPGGRSQVSTERCQPQQPKEERNAAGCAPTGKQNRDGRSDSVSLRTCLRHRTDHRVLCSEGCYLFTYRGSCGCATSKQHLLTVLLCPQCCLSGV